MTSSLRGDAFVADKERQQWPTLRTCVASRRTSASWQLVRLTGNTRSGSERQSTLASVKVDLANRLGGRGAWIFPFRQNFEKLSRQKLHRAFGQASIWHETDTQAFERSLCRRLLTTMIPAEHKQNWVSGDHPCQAHLRRFFHRMHRTGHHATLWQIRPTAAWFATLAAAMAEPETMYTVVLYPFPLSSSEFRPATGIELPACAFAEHPHDRAESSSGVALKLNATVSADLWRLHYFRANTSKGSCALVDARSVLAVVYRRGTDDAAIKS